MWTPVPPILKMQQLLFDRLINITTLTGWDMETLNSHKKPYFLSIVLESWSATKHSLIGRISWYITLNYLPTIANVTDSELLFDKGILLISQSETFQILGHIKGFGLLFIERLLFWKIKIINNSNKFCIDRFDVMYNLLRYVSQP